MVDWTRRRSVRKFLANRLAVGAMLVIACYLLVALSVSLGVIAKEDTFVRVGPKSLPGLFREQSPEKRVADCEFVLNQFDRAKQKVESPGCGKRNRVRLSNLRGPATGGIEMERWRSV